MLNYKIPVEKYFIFDVTTRSGSIHGARRRFWWQISTDFSTRVLVHRVYNFLHRVIHRRWNTRILYIYTNFFSSHQFNSHDKNNKITIIERHILPYKTRYIMWRPPNIRSSVFRYMTLRSVQEYSLPDPFRPSDVNEKFLLNWSPSCYIIEPASAPSIHQYLLWLSCDL
jgi:hypothetical protein